MADQASKPTYLVDDRDRVDLIANASAPHVVAPAEAHPNAFLGELARAMHQAATSQHERLTAELERLSVEQVEVIEARATAEVESLQVASDADLAAVQSWAQAETDRIGLERERRVDAGRERIASQLDRAHAIKDRELFAVQVAADGHRNEIDQFFERLEREGHPAAIARIASTLPPLPAFEEIAEDARRGAEAEFTALPEPAEPEPDESTLLPLTPLPAQPDDEHEPIAPISHSRLMAVMDPAASRHAGGEPARPWEVQPYAVGLASGPSTGQVFPAEWPRVESRSYAILPRPRSGARLLQAVPANRPAAGRDPDVDDPGAGH